MQKRKTICIWLWALLLLGLPSPLRATMVRQVSLEEMTARAERIFIGEVIAVKNGKDEHGIPVIYVTFAVARTLKGVVPYQLTIKQLGGHAAGERGSIFHIPGLPTYQQGEELVLFLHGTSSGGFTSPVGFGQGKCTVIREGSKAFIRNELGGMGLQLQRLHGMRGVPEQAGTRELEQFLSTVEHLVHSLD